jgi:hypothetical protein
MLDTLKVLVTRILALLGVTGTIATGAAVDRAQRMLREFNDIIPALKALGLSVSIMSLKMGLPPEIAATLVGSVDTLDADAIRTFQEQRADNRAIAVILEALILASTFRDQLTALGVSGIKVDVRLGLLPSVQVGLLTPAAALIALPARAPVALTA